MRRNPSRAPATLLLLSLGLALAACSGGANGGGFVGPDQLTPRQAAFLDTLTQRTFAFFWERSDPATGLTPDRWPTPSFSSIAAVGFALTAYPIGVERGLVTRSEAADRVLTTLRWFWQAPQGTAAAGTAGYQGFFYHFLDMSSGTRFKDVELSTVDTALLLGGVLFCQQYFDQSGTTETAIRAYADSLYRRADWSWIQPRAPAIAMGWTPEQGFHTYDWRGYDEAMLVYLLALGSPTHPVDSAAWQAWTRDYQWGTFYGESQLGFAPLFGHQYSQIWVDFRGIQDAWMAAHGEDYFENSRRATLSQRSYAIANPQNWAGYGADLWGLTASDGPRDTTMAVAGASRRFYTYAARGASFTEIRDDGTIAPTAAGGSIAFAPEVSIPVLLAMRDRFGSRLFGQYGFVDAFNLTWPTDVPPQMGQVAPDTGWFDTDYLGIDQGPIVAMVENYRSGLIWKYMRRSPYIIRGLRRAGFHGGWLDQAPATP